MTEPTTTTGDSARKPTYLAYDISPWGGDPAEPESLGVGFAHRDGNGFDCLLDGFPLAGKLMLRKPGAATVGVTSLAGGFPARRPDYVAYVVKDGKTRDQKGFWRRIGLGFRHADGDGIELLYKVMPTNGRLVLRTNDQK
jgi:hypothetical protein